MNLGRFNLFCIFDKTNVVDCFKDILGLKPKPREQPLTTTTVRGFLFYSIAYEIKTSIRPIEIYYFKTK